MVYNNMSASHAIEAGVDLERSHIAEKRTLCLDVPSHCAPLPGVRAHRLQDRRHRLSVTWLELPFVRLARSGDAARATAVPQTMTNIFPSTGDWLSVLY